MYRTVYRYENYSLTFLSYSNYFVLGRGSIVDYFVGVSQQSDVYVVQEGFAKSF